MYYDLNIPIPTPANLKHVTPSNKKKGKQKENAGASEKVASSAQTNPQQAQEISLFSRAQIEAMEKKIDSLVHLGYTVLALNQTIQSSFSLSSHINEAKELLSKLRKREGVIILTRLTIVLDDASESGTGLAKANNNALLEYDILSLLPTTAATFSIACLKHSAPSSLTAHVISLPLTGPRLPFFFKHTLVRTALKNGAALEVCYSPAVGGAGEVERRNWWAACRELTRVTAGKGVIFSSGTSPSLTADVRAPMDVTNLAVMLGIAQDEAKKALSETCKKLVIRAHTRKTHMAVLSEPRLVIPESKTPESDAAKTSGVKNDESGAKRHREDDEEEMRETPPSKRPKL